MKQFLTALVLLLAIFLAFTRLAEVSRVVATLQHGNVFWLTLAALAQLAWLVNVAMVFRSTYRLLGMDAGLWQLLPLVIAGNFLNVVAPSGGVSGMAVFIADARRRNLSTARVTIAGVLFLLFDYAGFLVVLAVGLLVLVRRNQMTAADIGATIILLGIATVMASLLALGVRSAEELERALVWGARLVNRLLRPILRRDYLSESRAHSFAAEAAEGLSALRTHWTDYLLPTALSLSAKALLIAVLFLTFLAFGQPFSVGTLIAGFSIGFLFLIVSPMPSGIGIVEGVMTLALVSLRVPLEAATVITLAYRGITFWLPFGYGFVALRYLQRTGTAPA